MIIPEARSLDRFYSQWQQIFWLCNIKLNCKLKRKRSKGVEEKVGIGRSDKIEGGRRGRELSVMWAVRKRRRRLEWLDREHCLRVCISVSVVCFYYRCCPRICVSPGNTRTNNHCIIFRSYQTYIHFFHI